VASAFGRKFLGFALWVAKGREVKCAPVAAKAAGDFKQRIRQLTRRSGGRSMEEVVERLRPYLLGWKAYFGLAQTPGSGESWTNGCATACGHPAQALEAGQDDLPGTQGWARRDDVPKQVAGNCHVAGGATAALHQRVLTIAYFDRLGVPRLS
jgi:RNA-directed DNA polymerase